MGYIEIEVEDFLQGEPFDNPILAWVENLWQFRLTSISYQALFNLLRSSQLPINFLISGTCLGYDDILLLQKVLGITSPIGKFISSNEVDKERLCKIILGHPSSLKAENCQFTLENFSELTAVCIYEKPIHYNKIISTYEQRIGLPYSSGKRDGIFLEDYTSRIFLPAVSKKTCDMFIGGNSTENHWTGIPRFHSELQITKHATLASSMNGVSVYNDAVLPSGYYSLEALFVADNCASIMLNLHAQFADKEYFDCQVAFTETVSPNQVVNQLFVHYDGSKIFVSAYFRLPRDAQSFSVKWFLGPQKLNTHSSSLLIKHMKLLRIKEGWGH